MDWDTELTSIKGGRSFLRTVLVCAGVFALGIVLNLFAGGNWGAALIIGSVIVPLATWWNVRRDGGTLDWSWRSH